jgi:murein tripeptide amidase MpaA
VPRTPLARALLGAALVLAVSVQGAPTAVAGDDPDPVPDEPHAYSLARAKQVVERRVIGTSVRGRDIVAFRKGNPDAERTVLVIGQMHGDERAGTVTAHWIRTRLPVDSDVDLWIVPTMNPDGLAAHTRKNARGVDLNRNWPTDGWVRTSRGSITYGGRRPASEPETRAMIAFLREVQPDWITSVHQPYGQVGRNGKTPLLVRRLAHELHLPIAHITVGTPDDHVAPTLASWYNATFDGGAVTVEYTAHPTRRFVTTVAGRGILAANLAAW